MKKFIASVFAMGLIATASSVSAAEGEYYNEVKAQPANVDQGHTGSIADRSGMQVKTSRDNRLPFDNDPGSYYQGAQRPQ